MASLTSRILLSLWSLLFLVAIGFWTHSSNDDPYRCRPLLDTGRWLDTPDQNGTRKSFRQWQPDGCMVHQYSSKDVRKCMEGRSIILGGDSLNRQIGYGIGRILAQGIASRDQERIPKQSDSHFSYYGVEIANIWNPWLYTNSSENVTLIRELALFRDEIENPPASIKDQKGPAMILVGGGAWFSFGKNERERQALMSNYQNALTSLNDLVEWDMKGFFTAPMDDDGVGNRIFFAPPNLPAYMGDDPMTSKNKSEARAEVVKIQEWLHTVNDNYNFPFAWSMAEMSDHDNETIVDPERSGFHVTNTVAEAKANIYLNLRCNGKLIRLNERPFTGTCCIDYGGKPTSQEIAMYFGLAFLIVCLSCEMLDFMCCRSVPRFSLLSMSTGGAFILPLLMSYYADRTQMMAKGEHVWSSVTFVILCLPWIILGLVTMRKSSEHQFDSGTTAVDSNPSILSRDQANEWKGWMQLALLVYRWVDGNRPIGMSVFASVLASSYIFQSGYGHTSYFLLKKDFSFTRVARVLLRLNLLTYSLCFFTNSNYSEYPFIPLSNFWFVVVWAILFFSHKRNNQDIQTILANIFISAATITFFFKFTPASQWTYKLLNACFNLQWDWKAWERRLGNDLYITYAGMIAAIIKHRYTWSLSYPLRFSLAMLSILILGGFWSLWSKENDSMPFSNCMPGYPFVSIGPVLAYLFLRNASPTLRSYHSDMLAWVGRCSLEFYVLQFHLLQAVTGHGVLLTGAFKGDGSLADRWRDLFLIVPVFIWISYRASSATRELVKSIMPQGLHESSEDYIPLSNTEEKDDKDDITDGFNNSLPESTLGLLRRLWGDLKKGSWSIRYPQFPPFKSLIFSPQGRLFLLLVATWTLNLLSPGPSKINIDNYVLDEGEALSSNGSGH